MHHHPATTTLPTITRSDEILVIAVAILAGLIIGAGYLLLCHIAPLTRCPRCHGLGKTPTGRGYRHCRRCDGSGYQVRPGARAWHHHRHILPSQPRTITRRHP